MQDRQTFGATATAFALLPVQTFAVQVFILSVAVVTFAALILPTILWALIAFGLLSFLVGHSLSRGDYPHDVFGLHNSVTLVRGALISLLFGTVFATEIVSPWLVFGIGAVALTLDGVDGWLARRAGLQSKFGARFDVETDAALAATLSLWLMVSDTTGMEVLILGFTRYVFVAVAWVVPCLNAELHPSMRRKIICVIQIGTLILLVLPVIPSVLVLTLAFCASSALLYSFAIDVFWLLRRPA